MPNEKDTDRLLDRIIVYGLSLSFSVVVATLETLRVEHSGFAFEVTWRTFAVLLVAGLVLVPCFQVIIHSERKGLRRATLATVSVIGVGSFFYPLRFVPREKMGDIFTGLGLAVIALAAAGGCLLWVRRLFEKDTPPEEPARDKAPQTGSADVDRR
jgi:hypothetical protein